MKAGLLLVALLVSGCGAATQERHAAPPAQLTTAGCTYAADGSGACGAEKIPPLTEYDADFCNDIDPQGTVIVLCRGTH